MKTSELQGAALDWAVAECEFQHIQKHGGHVKTWVLARHHAGETHRSDWCACGPIIERENICIDRMMNGQWVAVIRNDKGDTLPWSWGDTPMIAAMRCYVASKLGIEVEIPEELR